MKINNQTQFTHRRDNLMIEFELKFAKHNAKRNRNYNLFTKPDLSSVEGSERKLQRELNWLIL